MILIPAIDLKDGQCVRLRQGRMDDDTVFSDNPVEMAGRWYDAGARRLHLVDLNGAFEGKPVNGDIIQEITRTYPDLPVEIGGGIRTIETVEFYLDAGVAYVIIGTKAVEDPDFVTQLCKQFPGNVIVGLDAVDGKVAIKGWAEVSDVDLFDLSKRFENDGVDAIIYTDINRDGMMQGANVENTAALAQAISIPVIASGGIHDIKDVEDICKVAHHGISGAITGRAIYEGSLDFAAGQQLADKLLAK
ncbi:MAG: 1-(5-phosphoribosyl)-5-[(5-phosphoribosylamino)methylideneamino]imidazole-4-carboxamide isomerase [gamma proteobacterium symbiont of Bathyaustriella thionipta]|nr:1-(5-phosphoribosyl)-5-[(5-phosphoribosylamino)methylideneamino]imidazole-4-carboxamide isomerase [gamma proteobacterium symbiont of Bathyaustriella thionipta]MCU7949774.1 1-(5-phosphoribosyl)-5-[(5-phosphoribosylamino)methylideneamino]imidazole-4-carboxamide isomerase [gamma proteobacterium symbiont of Bathyaustriella thionipta]MCU7951988.1 1-(5-phosphoribosyl)-5-[(5-phosphoribosylamino)methylideneamino]imidazole-4-carboxamide isomerase [gamma proteobacterium symbiont of Bathyaustriella thion